MADNSGRSSACDSTAGVKLKQVAKKSTTQFPRKPSVETPNGCIRPQFSSIHDSSTATLHQSGNSRHEDSMLTVNKSSVMNGIVNGQSLSVNGKHAKEPALSESDDDSDGVLIINNDNPETDDVGPSQRTAGKRPLSNVSAEKDSKKVRLEEERKKKLVICRKSLDVWCSDRDKTSRDVEIDQLKNKVIELQDSVNKWKSLAFNLEKKLEQFVTQKSPSTSQLLPQPKAPTIAVRPAVPMSRSASSSTIASAVVIPRQDIPPNMLPPASAKLRMPASTSMSSLSSSSALSVINASSKSVIDLTDDDVPPLVPIGSNIRHPTGIVTPVTIARPSALILNNATSVVRHYSPTAAVRPTMIQNRPLPTVPLAVPIRGARPMTPIQFLTVRNRHPAPLPPMQSQIQGPLSAKRLPTKPTLKLSRVTQGIVLSWNMASTDDHEPAVQYQLFAYQEGPEPASSLLWKKVGTVEALPLPMACTLTQFLVGNRYHFAVRAVDCHGRIGAFSEPGSIHLEALSAS